MTLYTDLKNSLVGSPGTNSATSLTTASATGSTTGSTTGSDIQTTGITAQFCFSADLDLFAGHFPGNPILPGIVQIEMVKFTLEQARGTSFRIQSIKKTKFSNLIHPDTPIHLSIRLTPVDGSLLG